MGLLRVLLALSVVLGHLGTRYSLAGGLAAVQLFFIISGFYMETVLSGKYDPRRDLGLFYTNRFLRIYSVYFACLAVSVAVYGALYLKGEGFFAFVAANAGRLDTPAKAWLALTNVGIFGQDLALFQKIAAGHLVFNPAGNFGADPENALLWKFMAIPQAWTISLELMFYLAAPFLTRLSTRSLAALAAVSLLARMLTYAAGHDGDPWIYRFFPFETALFIYGMLARRFHDTFIDRITVRSRRMIGGGFIAACCLVQPAAHLLGAPMTLAVWPLYGAALIAVPCLFATPLFSKTLDAHLAALSYPVYLIHWIVIVAYGAMGLPAGMQAPGCIAGALAAGWVIVVFVERPMDRVRQALQRSRAAAAFSAPAFSTAVLLQPKPRRAVEAPASASLRATPAFIPGPLRPARRPQPEAP